MQMAVDGLGMDMSVVPVCARVLSVRCRLRVQLLRPGRVVLARLLELVTWHHGNAFAMCIGALIIPMGAVLLRRAVRDGGARKFVEDFSRREKESTGKTLRLLAILLVIFVYVYLLIPRIDYFLSTVVCLMIFISFFYLEGPGFLRRLFVFSLIGSLLLLGFFLLELDKQLTKIFPYSMDGSCSSSFLSMSVTAGV